jgi:Family of unknown function (DUF6263)
MGQGPVTLKWNFKEGEKFYVQDVTNMKQKAGFMGQSFDQTIKTTMVTSYTVKKTSSGSTTLVSKIEDVAVKSEGGLGAGELDKLLEKLKGATFTLTIDSHGKITKFEGYEQFIKNLTEGMEDAAKFIKLLVNEEVLKKSAEEAFDILPGKAVTKGDTWKRDRVIPLGPLGAFKATNEYSFQGVEDGQAKIGVKSQMKYSPPKGDTGFGALFKITKGNLKSEGARGNLYFDLKKGRLSKYNMALVFRGSLTLDVMGNMIEMELSADQESNSRVSDRNPLVEKKKE